MPSLSFEAAYRSLKRGDLGPVYYLTGSADVLKEELASAIANAAVESSSREFNLDVRSAGDLDGESVHALVETPPMLGPKRAVLIRDLEQWRANSRVWEVVYRYLERPSPDTVLILLHGAGEKPEPRIAEHATHVVVDAL